MLTSKLKSQLFSPSYSCDAGTFLTGWFSTLFGDNHSNDDDNSTAETSNVFIAYNYENDHVSYTGSTITSTNNSIPYYSFKANNSSTSIRKPSSSLSSSLLFITRTNNQIKIANHNGRRSSSKVPSMILVVTPTRRKRMEHDIYANPDVMISAITETTKATKLKATKEDIKPDDNRDDKESTPIVEEDVKQDNAGNCVIRHNSTISKSLSKVSCDASTKMVYNETSENDTTTIGTTIQDDNIFHTTTTFDEKEELFENLSQGNINNINKDCSNEMKQSKIVTIQAEKTISAVVSKKKHTFIDPILHALATTRLKKKGA